MEKRGKIKVKRVKYTPKGQNQDKKALGAYELAYTGGEGVWLKKNNGVEINLTN
jgi:hypothetical protein